MQSHNTLLMTTQTGTSAYEPESNEFGGGAQLLKDIDTIDDSYGSNPWGFTEFNGQLFFAADDSITGREIWVSDGTTEGTQLLVDINKTAYQYEKLGWFERRSSFPGSYPSSFTEFDGQLFFTAYDGITGEELWISDGTNSGTKIIKDINPDNSNPFYFYSFSGSSPSYFTEIDGRLLFAASDSRATNELWVSDGTTEGTQLLKDINTTDNDSSYNPYIPYRSSPSNFTEFDGQLFFTASDGITGNELWVSDGTTEGTKLLKDINTIARPSSYSNHPPSSSPSHLIEFNGQLFFTANDGIVGDELWVSDGTTEGTQLLKDINTIGSDYFGSNALSFVEFDGQLFFTANDGLVG